MPGAASLAIIKAAYDAGSLGDYERAALHALREVVPGAVAFFGREAGPGPGALGVNWRIVHRTANRWRHYDTELRPAFEHALANDGVTIDREVLGSYLATDVYREFVRPHAGHCTMLGILSIAGEKLGIVAIGRQRGSFSDRERRALASLIPTLAISEAATRRKGELWVALSGREREIISHLRLGHTNSQIAAAFGTSVNTVRVQLRSVLRKLDAANRVEAVALSLGHGAR